MKGADYRRSGKPGLELIEEAVHLLRQAPLATLGGYYLGTLPFILGLLYFWTDLGRNPFAYQHLADAALGMAALFLWMKCCQAVFACNLRAQAARQSAPPLGLRRAGRIFLSQTALQPTGLFLLPLALISVLSFPWACAFYQNLTALAGGDSGGLGSLVKKARRQTVFWPRQNITLLAVLFGFGLCVFVNWATICFLLPQLVKMLFGVESVFTRSGLSLLNSTFFATMFGMTYLCVDPVFKAAYALRCFYGESIQSGEDLKAELRQYGFPAAALALVLALTCAGSCYGETFAGTSAPARSVSTPNSPAPGISSADLDHAIQDTITQRKYTWRAPRESVAPPPEDTSLGVLGRFWDRIGEMIDDWLRKLFKDDQKSKVNSSGSDLGWIASLRFFLYAVIIVVAAALALLLVRSWRNGRRQPAVVATEPIRPTFDIADENLSAEQLPEDGWTRLGRELLARGELRLALRAFYLASLAHLAARNLITLAKFKSNRDYERELVRRGHSFPELLALFAQNVCVFDRTWYGLHEINSELVGQFAAKVQRIKGGAE